MARATLAVLSALLGLSAAATETATTGSFRFGSLPRARGGCGATDFHPLGKPVVLHDPMMACFNLTKAPDAHTTGMYVTIADIGATYDPTYYVENWCMLVMQFGGGYQVHCRLQPGDVVWAGHEETSNLPGIVVIDWAPQSCVPNEAKDPRCHQTAAAISSFRTNFTVGWSPQVVH
eukprot:TRINITY_DN1268_c0_g1_i1.p1 TRINITY_DN1268_c0_g1~~TRINITY_DN1268_c0_g1_i1.p1  ORF type:complete len:195 (+),score=22.77 TRINITY_DN1268_c0_g1_i1:59-586(+)